MDDTQIKNIIKQRRNSAFWGAVITFGVLAYFAFKQQLSIKTIVIVVVLVIVPVLIVYMVNFSNYPVPSKKYRAFNNLVYIRIARVFRVLFFIEAIINIKRTVNPLENYKKTGNPSHLEYLGDASSSGYLSHSNHGREKRGEIVEDWYKQKSIKASDTIKPGVD